MTERRWARVMSAVVAVLIGTLTMAGCATGQGPGPGGDRRGRNRGQFDSGRSQQVRAR